ncbi:hypothetical protein ACFL6R_05025 [Gemmatimonadota bacterium]
MGRNLPHLGPYEPPDPIPGKVEDLENQVRDLQNEVILHNEMLQSISQALSDIRVAFIIIAKADDIAEAQKQLRTKLGLRYYYESPFDLDKELIKHKEFKKETDTNLNKIKKIKKDLRVRRPL